MLLRRPILPTVAYQSPPSPVAGSRHRLADRARGHAYSRPSRVRVTNRCLTSVPDPGTTEPVKICYTLFRPAYASRKHHVPVIMHSHGWGGSRTTTRRRSSSGSRAGTPCCRSTSAASARAAARPRSRTPTSRATTSARSSSSSPPSGGSRRTAPATRGSGRSAAATAAATSSSAPSRSCARRASRSSTRSPPRSPGTTSTPAWRPQGVVRTEWALALSAAALPTQALSPEVYKALVQGAATGFWPDGSSRSPAREHGGVLREERSPLARLPGSPARHPRPLRPGHDRHPLQPPAGPRQLAHRDHPQGPQAQHLRRVQRRPHAARGLPAPASTSPPTRAASSSPAATSAPSPCASWTSSSSTSRPD